MKLFIITLILLPAVLSFPQERQVKVYVPSVEVPGDSLTIQAKHDLNLEREQLKKFFNWTKGKLHLSKEPIGKIAAETAKYFIGTDYEAATLEPGNEERLVIYFSGFDCTTLVENVLALARLVKKNDTSFASFERELTAIRYRDGKINQYPSRLHYFSDWIYDNAKKGLIKDVTDSLGGVKTSFDVNFMSTHTDAYKHLKANSAFVPVIKDQEKEISKREYYYIPSDKVGQVESKLRNGDIIAFTTSIKGLDITHVGIAVTQGDDRIHILHAPVPESHVQITDLPLPEYIKRIKKDTGIIVLRPLEP